MTRYGKFNESKNTASKKVEKHQAPREMISISLRDNRIGCYSESGEFNHSFFYNDLIFGCLEELELVLDQIPDDSDELSDSIKIIYVPGLIMALVTGLGDYIRLGKTSSGNVISKENLDKFLTVHEKIQDKSLNLNIRTYDMCPVEFGQKAKAFIQEQCKDANAEKDGVTRTTVTGAVNPAIEILNKQIITLVSEGKFEEAQKIAEILATMSNGTVAPTNKNSKKDSNDINDEEVQAKLLASLE